MKIILVLFSLILLGPVGITYADYGEGGKWFCNDLRPEFEKNDYKDLVRGFNNIAEQYFTKDPKATMSEKGDYLISQGLESIGQQAACIKDVHGIDPDSVAMFSPEVQEVFSYNMGKLIETAPTLVANATVPEFGSIVLLIMVISIIAVIVSTRKFQVIK